MATRVNEQKPIEAPKKKKKKLMYSHYCDPCGSVNADGSVILVMAVPFSNNSEPSHPMAKYKYREWWQAEAKKAWENAGSPVMTFAVLAMTFVFPDRRRRDFTNYCGSYGIKGILDGIKERLIPDDSSEFLELGRVRFRTDKTRPRLELLFQPEGPEITTVAPIIETPEPDEDVLKTGMKAQRKQWLDGWKSRPVVIEKVEKDCVIIRNHKNYRAKVTRERFFERYEMDYG